MDYEHRKIKTKTIQIEISYASKKAIEKVEKLGGSIKIKKEN